MTRPAGGAGDSEPQVPADRWRKLPDRIPPEEMGTDLASVDARDPAMERDAERDWMLRHI